jgi:peptide/nickel transport system ATP-binding protein
VLRAVDVTIARGGRVILEGVDLEVHQGRILGLLGPSGSGKTSLVRVLALLDQPRSGHVELDGRVVTGTRFRVPAELRRRIGLVLQHPRRAVDPRLTVGEIIAEPLLAAGVRRPDARVGEVADLVQLGRHLLPRRPDEVSDGQLQRATLARALVGQPRYLLLDEATASLDAASTAMFAQVVRDAREVQDLGVLTVGHDRELFDAWCDMVTDLRSLTGLRRLS